MFTCKVQLYGLSRQITELREAQIKINDGAGMAEVISELRKHIPKLEGVVIRPNEDRLVEDYKFNVNGHFYFDGMDFKLYPGDRIALLIPATGG